MRYRAQKPRIGLDLHVAHGIYQGSRTHVLELFSRVIALCPNFEFFLFADNHRSIREFSPAFSFPHVHCIEMPSANPVKRLCWQLPALIKKCRLDLVHTQYIIPPFGSCRSMVTIHDVLFESHPQFFNRGFVLRSRKLVRWSAAKAEHVFTVSDFSKRQILNYYKLPSASVTVIPNGVDVERFHPGRDGEDAVKSRQLTPGNYILSVGRLEPRKNHVGLLQSYALLPEPKPQLVFVGQRHFGYDEILRLVESLGIKNSVRFIEDVTDDELPALYRHAKLFVYPTWAEGFGMPVLEAMSSGIPTISTNATSLPEVVGEAGLLVGPGNNSALTLAMRQLLDDNALASRLSVQGLARARQFSWDFAAERVAAVYSTFFDSQLSSSLPVARASSS